MKALLGKKLAMDQVFADDGSVVPVTWVEAGPCTVVRTTEREGTRVAALAFGTKNHINKAQAGQFGELGAFATVQEFDLAPGEAAPERGTVITVETFAPGDLVNLVGTGKGRGFQGVVKRHGFHGSPATHGHKDQLRKSGSIGAGGIQRVFKGMRMAGRMGNNRVTVKNLRVMAVDPAQNRLALKGAIPGARGGAISLVSTDGNVWQK